MFEMNFNFRLYLLWADLFSFFFAQTAAETAQKY